MAMNEASAQKKIAELGMPDLPLIEVAPRPAKVDADWFKKYRDARRAFMMSLVDDVEDLAFLSLSREEFMDLVMGRKIPTNMSIRMRVPLVWGGALSPDNMFLCATFPHSHNMDRFIISQSGAPKIWMPNPAKKLYMPANTASGGAGGNATEDRLTQMAAQVAAARGGME